MFLTADDQEEIRRVFAAGHQASDLVPLLRRYAAQEELDKIPEAINFFTSLATVFRAQVSGFLTARVPAIVINHYWPAKLSNADYSRLVRYVVGQTDWSDKIIVAVRERQLGDAVEELRVEALASNV